MYLAAPMLTVNGISEVMFNMTDVIVLKGESVHCKVAE